MPEMVKKHEKETDCMWNEYSQNYKQ